MKDGITVRGKKNGKVKFRPTGRKNFRKEKSISYPFRSKLTFQKFKEKNKKPDVLNKNIGSEDRHNPFAVTLHFL